MGVQLDDPRNPLGWPRRRRSLRRRVAELERLLAEVEHDAAQALAELRARSLDDAKAIGELLKESHTHNALRRFDHEAAVGRLLAGEPEAAMRRTGSAPPLVTDE